MRRTEQASYWSIQAARSRDSVDKKEVVRKLRNTRELPRVEQISHGMSKRWGTGTVVIPAPSKLTK